MSFDDRRFTTDHAVDASPAAFTFTVPEPTVTHTVHVPTDHAVDATAAAFTFTVPQPTVTHVEYVEPDIAIADFDQTDLQTPIILAVFRADISGDFLTGASLDIEPIEGEVDVSAALTFGRIQRRASNIVRLYRDTGSTDAANAYFNATGTPQYPDAQLFIQTAADGRATYSDSPSGTNANFALSAQDGPVVDNIATGDFFLVAIAEPAVVTVDHAVDASPASFTFTVPQPTVTHVTHATTDHAVDAECRSLDVHSTSRHRHAHPLRPG